MKHERQVGTRRIGIFNHRWEGPWTQIFHSDLLRKPDETTKQANHANSEQECRHLSSPIRDILPSSACHAPRVVKF